MKNLIILTFLLRSFFLSAQSETDIQLAQHYFINGEFETTISLPIPIEFSNYDTIKVGNNDTMFNSRSGVYGSICNIVYYKNILSKNEIVNNYNLLSVNNPPI